MSGRGHLLSDDVKKYNKNNNDELSEQQRQLAQYSENHFKTSVKAIAGSFFCVFMSFNAAQALQSSLNGTLGNVCLATLYGTFTFACIIAPAVVEYFGPKMSMILGSIPYVLVILSNLQPSYATSVPANFLVGLGAPLLWTGEGIYLQRCAVSHARRNLVGQGQQDVLTAENVATSDLNGIFFSSFQLNGVFGLLLSSLILQNVSGDESKNILFIVLTVVAGVGAISLLFVPNVSSLDVEINLSMDQGSRQGSPEHGHKKDASSLSPFMSTIRLALFDTRMSLLILIIFYNGISLGFLFGDYTRYVISTSLGSDFNGYVMATFYAVNTVATLAFSKLASHPSIGRRGTISIASISHLLFYIFFLVWSVPSNYHENDDNKWVQDVSPDASTYFIVFAGAILFAIGDSILESQLPALLQTTFTATDQQANAAMSNLKMWQSLGFTAQFCLGFILADYFYAKVLIAATTLLISVGLLFVMHKFVSPIDNSDLGYGLVNAHPDGSGVEAEAESSTA